MTVWNLAMATLGTTSGKLKNLRDDGWIANEMPVAYGLKDWLPLVGVLVGWFLNQCAQWFIFRRDERKAIWSGSS